MTIMNENDDNMVELIRSNRGLWDLFTRKEEYDTTLRDKYNRFPYYLSNNKDIIYPVVSEFLMQRGYRIAYPNSKKFAVCLSHDIDAVYFTKLRLAYESYKCLKKSQVVKAFKMLTLNANKKSNPLWNFDKIMDLERKYNAKSSFFFLAIEKDVFAHTYRIEELKDELRSIVMKGWEVGLHGWHYAYNNLNIIREEKGRLEQVLDKEVIGYRSHFMRFEIPRTWELLRDAGFKYDTTFGYADCIGFRNGLCHPFVPFNLRTDKSIDILEIPLALMDGTLFDYMQLDVKNAWTITQRLIDGVEKQKGVLTILWHNSEMVDEKMEFYERILDYCAGKNAWMTSGEEIWSMWKGSKGIN